MHYLYDIWVNWFEGEEAGFNVCAYHEWRKQDQIEMVDQIPVLYITKDLFVAIENELFTLPTQLLQTIHKKTYIRKGYGRQVITYACIVTDGEDVLAFDTLGYKLALRKSRLIPRQERQVYEICKKVDRQIFELPRNKLVTTEQHVWQLKEHHVIGLTRRERRLKKLLLICLTQLKRTENKKEISYWLSEWEGVNFLLHTKRMSIDEVWNRLYEEVVSGWSERHETFLSQLVRGYPLIKHEWDGEQEPKKNKENQK